VYIFPPCAALPQEKHALICLQERLPLLVVRPLVLEPLPVLLDAADLLAVVVRHGVREALERRVDAVPLDVLEELPLSLSGRSSSSTSVTSPTGKMETLFLTSDICLTQRFLAMLNAAPPRVGPASQPAAPQPTAASPNTTNGSMPRIVCVTSISLLAR